MKKQKTADMKTTLQVPIKTTIKQKAEAKALAEGFDSLQAFTRFVITKYVNGGFNLNFVREEEYEIASPELEEKIGKAMESYKQGKYTTIKNKRELDSYFKRLNDENI